MKKNHMCARCKRHGVQTMDVRTKSGRLRTFCLRCAGELSAKGRKEFAQ